MEGSLLQQLFNYYVTNFGYLWDLFFKHLLMSVYGVLFAALIGIPLGILQDTQNFWICNYNCKYNSNSSSHCNVSYFNVSHGFRLRSSFNSVFICVTSIIKTLILV